MKKNEKPSFLKGKGAAVGIVICFVAAIALVGTYTFRNYENKIEDQTAKNDDRAEEQTKDNSTEETTAEDILLPESDANDGAGEMTEEDITGSDASDEQDEYGETAAAGDSTSAVWFSEDSILNWPASGAVIMSYSMDQTVFFQTLEQYKYNPAMIIAGEPGETITASAAGIVTDISQTAQTGMMVTLDMGNGYSAIYGQLQDVQLSVGDYVNTGDAVGILSQPTKYYSVEGPNLYFQVLKDGEPVDPMNYME